MADDNPSPPEPEQPRRLSFREANLGPEHRPEPRVKPQSFFVRRKRSVAVTLLAAGAATAAIYGWSQHNPNCDQLPPEQQQSCRQSSSGHGGSSTHFYSGSSGSSSSTSSDSHGVSRGGFGGSGSAHGGGGE